MRSLAQQRLGGSVQVEYPVVQFIQDRLSKFSTQFLPFIRRQIMPFFFQGEKRIEILDTTLLCGALSVFFHECVQRFYEFSSRMG